MSNQTKNLTTVEAAVRQVESKTVSLVGDSQAADTRCNAKLQALFAAASLALPIDYENLQAFASPTEWGSYIRPIRAKARTKAIRALARAGEIALEQYPQLELKHVEAALRSLRLCPQNLQINLVTGEWDNTRAAIAQQGRHIARALAELGLIVKELEVSQ